MPANIRSAWAMAVRRASGAGSAPGGTGSWPPGTKASSSGSGGPQATRARLRVNTTDASPSSITVAQAVIDGRAAHPGPQAGGRCQFGGDVAGVGVDVVEPDRHGEARVAGSVFWDEHQVRLDDR